MKKHHTLPLLIIGLMFGTLGGDLGGAHAQGVASDWPDTFDSRLEALALLQTLNSDLLSHDSATTTLGRWCALHKMAPYPHIIAVRTPADPRPPTADQRVELGVAPGEPVRYRHVELKCGSLVLSKADNWYVPARLSRPMNHQLETTDTPFGVIVRELNFHRHTLSARLLWTPLPEGWEMNSRDSAGTSGKLPVPEEVLQHRAVLSLPNGTPFSEVVETYTGNVLAFPAPRAPTANH